MRTNNLFSRLGAMLVAFALLLVVAGEASYAAGTTAGTVITSNAVANYNDKAGSGMPQVNATALSIYVAYKSVSTITVTNNNQTGVDNSYVVYTLNVTNDGNYSDAYAVEFTASDAKIQAINYYSDDLLTTELGGTSKNIVATAIAADGNTTVYAKVSIKLDNSYPSYDNTTIVGTFRSRSTRNETDTAITVGPATIPIGTGYAHKTFNATSATTTTIVESNFDLTATVSGGSVRPGTTVSYAVSYDNIGHGKASNVAISFYYPANMTFSSGTNWSNHNTYATYNTISSVAAASGSQDIGPIVLTVNNNANSIEGNNPSGGSFAIAFTDDQTNGLARTRVGPSSSVTNTGVTFAFKAFATTRFVSATIDTASNAEPSDSVTIHWKITNNSNGDDAYVIAYPVASEGTPWGFAYYQDTTGHVTLFNAAYSPYAYSTTATILRNGTGNIYIRTKVPSGLSGNVVQLTFAIRSARDSATVSGEAIEGFVHPMLPSIVVERSRVINPGDSVGTVTASVGVAPGGIVTYYIYVRNTGSGVASVVTITDDVTVNGFVDPPTMATINDGSAHTFAIPGGEQATFGKVAITGNCIVTTIDSLPAGASRIISYATTVH